MAPRAPQLALLALALVGAAGAQPKPPRALQPPAALSFSEARAYVQRATTVARALQPGAVLVWPTPQGPRLALQLTYQGRPVTFAFLTPDFHLVERGGAPLLTDAPGVPPTPTAHQRATLAARTAALNVSGLTQVLGPQVHCYLLSQGRAVAELHFDRRTAALIPDLGGPPPRPHPDRPPIR